MLPLGVPQVWIHGTEDRPVPVRLGRDYSAKAKLAGEEIRYVELPGAGHFDLVAPGSAAWKVVVDGVVNTLPQFPGK